MNVKIYEYISKTDIPTYQRIIKRYNFKPDKKHEKKANKKKDKKSDIELGDTIENLMRHSAYKRHKGALRQVRY